MGIDPHFNPWNYFFRVQLRSDSDTKAAVRGCTDIYVRIGQGIDPYFHLSVSNPSVGWRKDWFFLRNDIGVSLPMDTGRRPAAQPSWGTGWLRKTHVSYKSCEASSRV
jgi:hypothetical protein